MTCNNKGKWLIEKYLECSGEQLVSLFHINMLKPESKARSENIIIID